VSLSLKHVPDRGKDCEKRLCGGAHYKLVTVRRADAASSSAERIFAIVSAGSALEKMDVPATTTLAPAREEAAAMG
jgi:hypothetical protein